MDFIIPVRNRDNHISGFIQNIKTFYPNSNIILVEQVDDNKFAKGQLNNLGFLNSTSDLLIFMDIDIRFTLRVDFEAEMQVLDHPFVGFDQIIQVNEDETEFQITRPRHDDISLNWGMCCVFTREQFENANGYSNMYFNWGSEDDSLAKRINGYKRIQNILYHVAHLSNYNHEEYLKNYELLITENLRNKLKDGYRQTIAEKVSEIVEDNVLFLKYRNISVNGDFEYLTLLEKRLRV